ncbi:MAG: hypothetical protein ACLGGX_11915 [Bdellovibrionia bacterium]
MWFWGVFIKKYRTPIFRGILIFTLFFSRELWACTSPTGVEGQMTLISTAMRYCNGTSWVAMNDTVIGPACGELGRVEYVSGEIVYCNGSQWVRTAPVVDQGTCSAAEGGRFYYDTSGKYYWFCNGSAWRRMGP